MNYRVTQSSYIQSKNPNSLGSSSKNSSPSKQKLSAEQALEEQIKAAKAEVKRLKKAGANKSDTCAIEKAIESRDQCLLNLLMNKQGEFDVSSQTVDEIIDLVLIDKYEGSSNNNQTIVAGEDLDLIAKEYSGKEVSNWDKVIDNFKIEEAFGSILVNLDTSEEAINAKILDEKNKIANLNKMLYAAPFSKGFIKNFEAPYTSAIAKDQGVKNKIVQDKKIGRKDSRVNGFKLKS